MPSHLASDPTATRRRVVQLINEGARLLHARRPGEALATLTEAYELAPDDPDVAINLGGALIMTARWRRAVAVLEQAVAIHPDNVRLWINLAAAYLGRLEIASPAAQERAIAAYERALTLDPQAPGVHYNLGLIYAERREWEQAAHWFSEALRLWPDDADAAWWLQRAQSAATASES
jgi:tetratricopeptide (TPR) repeat protein